ncbi:RDD family protein [Aquabacterium sp. OR-4]|uniref:RDD family protein n=1 Tax=Aquabacterium sp. OR-4 TaxID=2978127 RepID=UPI0021B432E6|nr:RDD family protein [Aquabacterium sp. OR-4]MDT7835257.1 RDD family protein [Aquabacterium sp. OR-4]
MSATAPPDAAGPAVPLPGLRAPALRRRLAAFVYEGVLLFGVLMMAGLVYGSLTQQRHALQGRVGLQLFVFAVLGLYFVWFWTHGGQTVAMKAWHLRLVDAQGAPLGLLRALTRYLLSWLWFVPALLALWLSGLHGGGVSFGMLLAGVLGYAALAFLRPDGQYWHDAVCGTRVIDWRPARPGAVSPSTGSQPVA